MAVLAMGPEQCLPAAKCRGSAGGADKSRTKLKPNEDESTGGSLLHACMQGDAGSPGKKIAHSAAGPQQGMGRQ
jgi:hypothetical protein